MGALLLCGCLDCDDSPSVLVGDVCGSSDAAIPAATSLSPSRRLISPVELRAISVAAGAPRCDLLDQPRITVGISEGEERSIARALRVRTGKPCFQGERRAVPHRTRLDATADEFGMRRFDVGDNQRRRGRAGRCPGYSGAEVDRA